MVACGLNEEGNTAPVIAETEVALVAADSPSTSVPSPTVTDESKAVVLSKNTSDDIS